MIERSDETSASHCAALSGELVGAHADAQTDMLKARTIDRTAPDALWRLTFDMSGGPKGAKRPLGRPLDGGVRCLLEQRSVFATHVTMALGSYQRRPRGRVAVRSRSVAGVGACADARIGGRQA